VPDVAGGAEEPVGEGGGGVADVVAEALGAVVGTTDGAVDGAVEGAVDDGAIPVCPLAAMVQPAGPAFGAPARSHEASVAISVALSRAFGGGGIGFVSLAIRSAATLATVRVASLFAACRKSSAPRSVMGTPKFSGGA
jgi:hypothetical protein